MIKWPGNGTSDGKESLTTTGLLTAVTPLDDEYGVSSEELDAAVDMDEDDEACDEHDGGGERLSAGESGFTPIRRPVE